MLIIHLTKFLINVGKYIPCRLLRREKTWNGGERKQEEDDFFFAFSFLISHVGEGDDKEIFEQ